ncbi:DUF342 domain-containing protein [Ralstonia pickettii]|nr:DUF342 domain-containing protein [Ralstonia pickettii]
MDMLAEYFRIIFLKKKMIAQIECKDAFFELEEEMKIDEQALKDFLASHQVVHGLQYEAIDLFAKFPAQMEYPLTIAKGQPPVNGTDGRVEYVFDFNEEINRDSAWNFRDVMKIPSVTKGQRLAKLIEPEKGIDGRDVMGSVIKALPGKPAVARAGKNVVYREEDKTFFATESGQFSLSGRKLNVFPEFEVNETLSLKKGNLDFVGTIIIRGDVPTGFTVKAEGDVKIYGMVEAATIIAGGSIFVTEGISGQEKGYLKAEGSIHIGYINQARVYTSNNLYVENSILHSECVVNGDVYCQKGSIAGGSISAGKTIEARDIGTRMNTKTEVTLGVNKVLSDREQELINKKQELENLLEKLKILGQKLETQDATNSKIRISLLRQKHTFAKTKEQLTDINEELSVIKSSIGDLREARLVVRNFIYQNVIVSFGKYKRSMKSNYHYIEIKLHEKEIAIHQLYG